MNLRFYFRRLHVKIKHKPTVLVMRPEGVAMIRVQYDIPYFSIYVNKPYRGQGYSIKLLEELFEKCRGKYDAIFGTICIDNNQMRYICRKLGFKKVGEFNNRYLMMKKLS